MSNRKKKRVNRLHIIFLVLLFIGLGYSLNYYYQRKSLEGFKQAYFLNPDGSKTEKLKLEIADTEEKRKVGLMYRKKLPEDQGMLFVFPEEQKRSMWMKNTYISLDMIFMDSKYKVVGVLKNVPPLNEEKREITAPAKYVLEVNAGIADRKGIKISSSLN